MIKLKNKFAIGCLVQWYEIEMISDYINSLNGAIKDIKNKENIIVDFKLVINQDLEKIDENQITMDEIIIKFKKMVNGFEFSVTEELLTISDYRRYFNDYYCNEVDVLMWGESDSLIPNQTFQVLDLLHTNNISNETYKYLTFFGTCKMWDNSWKPIEHIDFTDKKFGGEHSSKWYGTRYVMSIDEMNDINDKVENLDIRIVSPYKFNGCGLVISSDVIKSGANIPKSVFFTHEDTAFMNQCKTLFQESIPQFIIKNILLVHNREHPKKRLYVLDENGSSLGEQRKSNDWYTVASKFSEHNAYNTFKQSKNYTWGDVWEIIK